MIRNGALRTEYLTPVRITKEEKEEIEKRAHDLNMKISEYLRYCINKEMEDKDE